MKPTVGRIVHYHPKTQYPTMPADQRIEGPFAAIITKVHEDGERVGLDIRYPAGALQDRAEWNWGWHKQGTAPGEWSWPVIEKKD